MPSLRQVFLSTFGLEWRWGRQSSIPTRPPAPPPRSDPSSAQAGSANRLIFARVWGSCSVGFDKWLDCFILQIASFILLCSCLPAASLSCVIISGNSPFVLSPVGVPYWYSPVLCFWRCHGGTFWNFYLCPACLSSLLS